MSEKTTPGPWFLNSGESPIIIRNGDAPGDIHVCTISGSGSDLTSIADARLIAAAPDLLRRVIARVESCPCGMPKPANYLSLRRMTHLCEECREDLAAIAKTEG